MRQIFLKTTSVLLLFFTLVGCDTLKSIPTNTTGGAFSLNGNWQLGSTTENNSMVGTTVNVLPIAGNATIKTLANNSYCVSEGDVLWRSIKSNNAGGFTINALVGACNGTTIYKDAVINVINADQVTVTTRTAGGSELIQSWNRIKK